MTRRGKGQEPGSTEAQTRGRGGSGSSRPSPGRAGPLGPARPRAALQSPAPARRQGRCRKSRRHPAASDPIREPGATPTRAQAGRWEACGVPVGRPRGWWPQGRPTPGRGPRAGPEGRRGAQGLSAWGAPRSHFCPHPRQPPLRSAPRTMTIGHIRTHALDTGETVST